MLSNMITDLENIWVLRVLDVCHASRIAHSSTLFTNYQSVSTLERRVLLVFGLFWYISIQNQFRIPDILYVLEMYSVLLVKSFFIQICGGGCDKFYGRAEM